MRLPGFNAEVVLDGRSNENHAGGVWNGMQGHPRVSAQLRIGIDPVGQCFSRCFLNGGTPLGCFFACDPVTVRQFSRG
jgi:hypothetical protein